MSYEVRGKNRIRLDIIKNSDQIRLYKARTDLIHKSYWNLLIEKNKQITIKEWGQINGK